MLHGALQIHGQPGSRNSHRSHASHHHQALPSAHLHLTALGCMCERRGYAVREHGCCPVVLSLRGDWSVASPLPRALGSTCCLTPHASRAVSSCRLVSTLGLF